jgi:hypothetical protein
LILLYSTTLSSNGKPNTANTHLSLETLRVTLSYPEVLANNKMDCCSFTLQHILDVVQKTIDNLVDSGIIASTKVATIRNSNLRLIARWVVKCVRQNRLAANLLFLLSELRSSQELMNVLNTIMLSSIITLPEYQYSLPSISLKTMKVLKCETNRRKSGYA